MRAEAEERLLTAGNPAGDGKFAAILRRQGSQVPLFAFLHRARALRRDKLEPRWRIEEYFRVAERRFGLVLIRQDNAEVLPGEYLLWHVKVHDYGRAAHRYVAAAGSLEARVGIVIQMVTEDGGHGLDRRGAGR